MSGSPFITPGSWKKLKAYGPAIGIFVEDESNLYIVRGSDGHEWLSDRDAPAHRHRGDVGGGLFTSDWQVLEGDDCRRRRVSSSARD